MEVGPEPKPGPAAAGRDAALQAATDAAQAARDCTARLSQDIFPKLLVRRNFAIVGLVLWLGLAAGVFLGVSPGWLGLPAHQGLEWPLIAAGMAFGVSCIILLVIHVFASSRSAQAFEAFQQAVVDARFQAQHWQKLARQELQTCEQEYRSRQASISDRREKSLQQFAATREQRTEEISSRTTRTVGAAEVQRDRVLQAASERHNAELLATEAAHRRETNALRIRHEREQASLTRVHQQGAAERNIRRRDVTARVEAMWRDTLAWFAGAAADLAEDSRRAFPDWDAVLRPEWQPAEIIPPGIRIGDYVVTPGSGRQQRVDKRDAARYNAWGTGRPPTPAGRAAVSCGARFVARV